GNTTICVTISELVVLLTVREEDLGASTMKTFLLIGLIALTSVLTSTVGHPIYENEGWLLQYDDPDVVIVPQPKQEEFWTGSSDIYDVTIPAKPNTAVRRPIGSGLSKPVTPAPVITRQSPPASSPTYTKSSPSQVHTKESSNTRGPGDGAGQLPSSAGQTAGNSGGRPGATRPGGNRPSSSNRPGNNRPGNNRPGNNNRNKNKNKNSSEESDEDSYSQESAEEPSTGSDETLEEDS
ncbi:unnamed protein product, partial [Allacma fusca]